MKIKQIYDNAVKTGMELDPRGHEEVRASLERAKEEYQELRDRKKARFDTERLTNPYSDTRILADDPDLDVKRVLVGIDIEVGEVLLADRLKERSNPIDLMISHHPEGAALATLYEVMDMQSGILFKHGVPINVAEDIMAERIKEVERRLLPINHTRAVDAARLLGIPFMCIHTPADNAVTSFLQALFDESPPRYVSDIIDTLVEIPEYEAAIGHRVAPKVITGSEKRRAGRVFVDMTGGTGGSKKVFEGLKTSGVGTIVGMHMSEEHRKEAEKHHINVVIAGHVSSDNLGMNLLMDEILDGVEVVACSGFKRVVKRGV